MNQLSEHMLVAATMSSFTSVTFTDLFAIVAVLTSFVTVFAGFVATYQARRTAKLQQNLEYQAKESQKVFFGVHREIEDRARRTTIEVANSADGLFAFQKSFEQSSKMTQDAVRELSRLTAIIQSTVSPLHSLTQEVHDLSQRLNSPLTQIQIIDTPGATVHLHQDTVDSNIPDRLTIYHQVSNEYAHIIATPLASIDSAISTIRERFTSLLQAANASPNDSRILLSFLENAAISLESIKSILQHGAGFLPDVAERLSINTIVRKAIRMTSTVTSDRVEPLVSLQNIPEVKYYPANLLIALIQILGNAYEALHHEGTINIDGTYSTSSNKISLFISNAGDPIPQEDQLKIFEQGFSTKANGRGSGLAIARRCLEEVNGSVDLLSSNSDRTTFVVSFQPVEDYD